MRLRLVVPPDVDAPTGGNVYDLALARALRAAGDEVVLRRCAAHELAGLLRHRWDGRTLVDGLLACRHPDAVASGDAAVLVHMPLALQTGLPAEQAARIDQAEQAALHAASAVVTTSHWCARYVARHHGVSRVAVATPGSEPAPLVSGSDPPLLVHVAALLPHKDQVGVVTALARLTDLPWRARLAGDLVRDPAYAAAVRAAVQTAALSDRVEISGVLPRESAWAGADLALLPSRVESFGMAVTEALARGVPVVVGKGTGAQEALGRAPDGTRPGALVTPGDPEALATTVRRWLTDGEHRQVLRAAALARRTTLEGWEATARRVRKALDRG